MIRYPKKFTIEEVLSLVPEQTYVDDYYSIIDGQRFKRISQRLVLFKTKGCKCVKCGLEGTVFYLEKHPKDKHYHMNLYGYDINGNEVLMTKDHIIPKSKGGLNHMKNYQPMCIKCNEKKGNK